MSSKPTSQEIALNLSNINGTERIRISKFENGEWANYYITDLTLKNWILSQIIIPPTSTQLQSNWTEVNPISVQFIQNKPLISPVEMTTAQRILYSGIPIIAIDTDESDANTCATYIFRGGLPAGLNRWTPL